VNGVPSALKNRRRGPSLENVSVTLLELRTPGMARPADQARLNPPPVFAATLKSVRCRGMTFVCPSVPICRRPRYAVM
jgi:hypothetical protein